MNPSAARTCATCHAQRLLSEPAFQRCAGCRKVVYCSRGCQQAGWAPHKPRCASQNLLRAYYSEDGLTLTFTLNDVRPKKPDNFRPLTDRMRIAHHLHPPPRTRRLEFLAYLYGRVCGRPQIRSDQSLHDLVATAAKRWRRLGICGRWVDSV
jgi:hypothetical protein